jgi:hypothetical protein
MKKALFLFAVTGWTLGLLVHVLSVIDIDVDAKAPYVWLLHLGIFVVWIPAIILLKKNAGQKTFQGASVKKSFSPFGQFKALFTNTPNWLTVIAVTGFFYAFINFMSFMSAQHGTPAIENGQYMLHNHGQFVRNLTKAEYNHYQANTLRGFSGHWIAFYGLAMAILYPFNSQIDNK